jgi:hypothetical protein
MGTVDLTLIGSTTALSAGVVATTPDQTTAIISIVAQVIGLVTFIIKTRKERRARRKMQKPNYSQK